MGALVDACYSGQYTREQMHRKLNGLGGMMAYVNDNDVLSVYNKGLAGDKQCMEVIDAMVYQLSLIHIFTYKKLLQGPQEK